MYNFLVQLVLGIITEHSVELLVFHFQELNFHLQHVVLIKCLHNCRNLVVLKAKQSRQANIRKRYKKPYVVFVTFFERSLRSEFQYVKYNKLAFITI